MVKPAHTALIVGYIEETDSTEPEKLKLRLLMLARGSLVSRPLLGSVKPLPAAFSHIQKNQNASIRDRVNGSVYCQFQLCAGCLRPTDLHTLMFVCPCAYFGFSAQEW